MAILHNFGILSNILFNIVTMCAMSTNISVSFDLHSPLSITFPAGDLDSRGITKFSGHITEHDGSDALAARVSKAYDIKLLQATLKKHNCSTYIPISPSYKGLPTFPKCKRPPANDEKQKHSELSAVGHVHRFVCNVPPKEPLTTRRYSH